METSHPSLVMFLSPSFDFFKVKEDDRFGPVTVLAVFQSAMRQKRFGQTSKIIAISFSFF